MRRRKKLQLKKYSLPSMITVKIIIYPANDMPRVGR